MDFSFLSTNDGFVDYVHYSNNICLADGVSETGFCRLVGGVYEVLCSSSEIIALAIEYLESKNIRIDIQVNELGYYYNLYRGWADIIFSFEEPQGFEERLDCLFDAIKNGFEVFLEIGGKS